EINQPDFAITGNKHILRLEIQVHEPVLMHVFERDRHVDQNLRYIFEENRIVLSVKLLQVSGFDILHQQIELTVYLPMLDIAYDTFVIRELRKDVATAKEPASGQKVKAQSLMHQAEGVSFVSGVGGQPNISHTTAIEKFLKIKAAERPGRYRLGS